MCPKCRKLVSREQEICPWCGLTNPGKWFRFGTPMAYFARSGWILQCLIVLSVAFFTLSLLFNLQGVRWDLNPLTALTPDSRVLLVLGATGTRPVFGFGGWWTLVTAGFLHAGILHLLFNMAALHHLGNFSEPIFGPFRMLLVYLVGTVTGFALSLVGGVEFTIGASAGICGLIGALLYYGWHRGGNYGRAMLKHTQGWVISLVIFGALMPGINNWGHAGGLFGGFLTAMFLGYTEIRSETMTMRLGAMVGACITLALLLHSFVLALRVFRPFAFFS